MSAIFTLARDGQRPVRFTGTLLAETSGAWSRGKDQHRYYELAIYQTEDGRYVTQWQYKTRWQGEEDHARVEVASTLASVMTNLEEFDPNAWVQGYKSLIATHPHYAIPGQEYYERQQALERGIRERYQAQVRDLCTALSQTHDIAEEL